MLRIEGIQISNLNSITSLNLSFRSGVNILCGSNGVGKTTILDCISQPFRLYNHNIRKSVNTVNGFCNITVNLDNKITNYSYDTVEKDPFELQRNEDNIPSNEFIYHRINQRISPYKTNTERPPRTEFDAIKKWFYRYYFKKEEISSISFSNFTLVKEIFNKLDSNVTFVEAIETEDPRFKQKYINILVETKHGIINMDFLSSGYKACLCILLGIVRSIESRIEINAQEFRGVILIDEIDLHLHPEWQTKIIDILKWLVPNSQIIISTHSPHVIQTAEQGEIIPLGIDKNNRVFVRKLPESSEYGYQGWTIEEILVDVMGLSDPRSKIFIETLKKFEDAMDIEDGQKVIESYKSLKSMVHNRNPLATLLRIQAGEFFEEEGLND